MLKPNKIPLSLYIHIPWCIRKCPYCDFNSYVFCQKDVFSEEYVDILIRDLQCDLLKMHHDQRELVSIFIGGGTPTLFSARTIVDLLEKVYQLISVKNNIEITIEANPGTVNISDLKLLRSVINRISFGAQSFQEDKLKAIGRIHNVEDILLAVDLAIKAGFDNVNLDLMYGLPGQSINDVLSDINIASSLNLSHLSWYQLTIEQDTVFYHHTPNIPDEDTIFSMQVNGQKLLQEYGYERYEISAYSKSKKECTHNLNYWEFGDYLGIGAGAHSKITYHNNEILRSIKYGDPKFYMQQTKNFIAEVRKVSSRELILEFMMNALRLCKPINLKLFNERTGLSNKVLINGLRQAQEYNYIEKEGSYIKTTEQGRNFLNDLICLFM